MKHPIRPETLQVVGAFCRRNRVRRLMLFGSALRDDFGPNSDFDLLIEFEPEAQVGFMALARIQRELSLLLGRRVDLVPRNGLKPTLNYVLADAEELYAA